MNPQYNLFLAKSGWAVYERETLRVVEIDGVPQMGLNFGSAERAATILNSFNEPPDPDPKPQQVEPSPATFH